MSSNDDNLLKLRLSNVRETQKRIHHLFSLIYLLFFLIALAWHNINFESSDLKRKIDELDEAVSIKVLKPWDNFLKRTESCFHSYFLRTPVNNDIVTRANLETYLKFFEAKNKENEPLIDLGYEKPYPLSKIKTLLESEDCCVFWARQDTMISFLFSLDYYLKTYFQARFHALSNDDLEGFYAETEWIDTTVNSFLYYLSKEIDSLISPFERPAMAGLNPMESGLPSLTMGLGYEEDFEEYSSYHFSELLLKLQKVNHLSWFKKQMVSSKGVLLRIQSDLDSILNRTSIEYDIRPSDREIYKKFYSLSTILNSRLLILPDLPDSIQLPHLCNLTYFNIADNPLSDTLLFIYFPTYAKVLKDYNLGKPGGVETLRNILVSQAGVVKQNIQILGAGISSSSILLFLPLICASFYLIILLSMRHLSILLRLDRDRFCEEADSTAVQNELLKAPLFIAFFPKWLGRIMILIPAVMIACMLTIQIVLIDRQGLTLNFFFVFVLILLFPIMGLFAFRYTAILQKMISYTKASSSEITDEKQDSPRPDRPSNQ